MNAFGLVQYSFKQVQLYYLEKMIIYVRYIFQLTLGKIEIPRLFGVHRRKRTEGRKDR